MSRIFGDVALAWGVSLLTAVYLTPGDTGLRGVGAGMLIAFGAVLVSWKELPRG